MGAVVALVGRALAAGACATRAARLARLAGVPDEPEAILRLHRRRLRLRRVRSRHHARRRARAESDLYEVVEAHIEKPLRVYVYSYDFDTMREVVLVPNRQWGGEGLLGCVFGFGILHRIPVVPTSASAHNTVIFRPPSTVPASESSGSAVVVPSERDEDSVY